MKKKRILFTGGGTAGHVIVNVALIPLFQKEGWEIDYIGSKDGIERKLISELPGVQYYPISTGKLRRYMSIENIKDPFKVLKGIFQAWRIIGKRKPSVIFSKGGFVSVPVVLAAKLRGVPTVIHESDYTPGLANKLSMPFVKQILTTFPETLKYVNQKKATYVGAVVREELFMGDRQKGLKLTHFTTDKPVLLIMGGSAGSQKMNEIVRDSLDTLLDHFQIIHICGEGHVDEKLNQAGYVQFGYVNEELKDLLAITNFVISRAGANAIFEFLALKIPMLLIPLSRAASRGDQIINAKSFTKSGYARTIEEEQLTKESFIDEITQLQKHAPALLETMKNYQSDQARDTVMAIIKENSK